ncbi:hypothetical protein BHE74_00052966, partial [Ensete ventricosum]
HDARQSPDQRGGGGGDPELRPPSQLQHLRLRPTDLYTLPSEVLMDGAAKALVLNQHYQTTMFDRVHDAGRVITSLDGKVNLLCQELQDLKEGGNPDVVAANDCRALADADLEIARAESASLERQLADLQEQLDDYEGQLRGVRAQVRQMETELLNLARSKDALREELLRRVIEDYKKSPGFEMGLMRMGRVSLEYEYQLALARLQARHPEVEIELDPFVSLPKDDDVPMANDVPMADEQPFDDSLPPPKE